MESWLENSNFLILCCPIFKFLLYFLILPLNVDKAHIRCNLFNQGVLRCRIISDHQPLHWIDHLSFELDSVLLTKLLFEFVKYFMILHHYLPKSYQPVWLIWLLMHSPQTHLYPIVIVSWYLLLWSTVPIWDQDVQCLLYEGSNLIVTIWKAFKSPNQN